MTYQRNTWEMRQEKQGNKEETAKNTVAAALALWERRWFVVVGCLSSSIGRKR